jgi:hypothetical protein
VLLVPLFLAASAFHHPTIWWWCWAAIGVWLCERLWRATWWLHTNGYFGGMSPLENKNQIAPRREDMGQQAWQMSSPSQFNRYGQQYDPPIYTSPTSPYHTNYKSPLSPTEDQRFLTSPQALSPKGKIQRLESASIASSLQPPTWTSSTYVPPPGYVHIEFLAGRTMRLRFLSPGFLSWAPGQYFLVNIPFVSRFTSHPFTVASVCDEQGPDGGRVMVLLIRTKNGWTKDLWDTVTRLTNHGQACPYNEHPCNRADLPVRGVLMRMNVDGPFGSSVRARWEAHSTVLVVAGGSGVSFGLSLLEYMCMCMSGRDGKYLGGRPGGWGKKGFTTSRIRFVWLVREFCE